MPRNQPLLHDAMRAILLAQPAQTATLQVLSEENVRLDLYRQQKGDGPHPPPVQFKLRTFRDPELQFLSPDKVQYVGRAEIPNI
jgi:hypothetical protein